MGYGIREGELLIQLARESIHSFFTGALMHFEPYKKKLSQPQGVFVTLFNGGYLRGSIGYPHTKYPLYRAVFHTARSAAFEDKRFPRLTLQEFPSIEIEVSIISEPELLQVKKHQDYLKKIHLGKEGLLIEGIYGKCALLPQVAVDNKWTLEEFLNGLCTEAGLSPDAWHDLKNKVYRFTMQTFTEKK